MINASSSWPDQKICPNEPITLEVKQVHTVQVQPNLTTLTLPADVSSWLRLIRVTAFVFRFINKCRRLKTSHSKKCLHVEEIKNAQLFWIKHVQNECFSKEISALKNKTRLPLSSPLLSLDIFIDESGLIRVGGRLHNTEMPSEQRHPIVLPKTRISELLVQYMHEKTYHGGIQLTLRVLREQFWVLKARSLVRKLIHLCVTCVEARAKPEEQFMAKLPAVRVQHSRPFSHCGVDYAGPIQVRNSSGRGYKCHKAYISLFVCLSTRAIHLELVHDYSTAAFIAALERFCARRGLPSCMYSDNGTTFQGAERELREAFKTILNDPNLCDYVASDQINWQFLPPSALHYGGVWEAGIKSVKHHFKRVLKSATPTGEELTTLLCNVEACLNSRPIAPLKDDVSSFDALTPGHFLVGSSLKSIPMPSVLNVNENRLNRWKYMQQKYEQFWKIWPKDYLHSLQQRSKWRIRKPNLEIGNLVLLKNALLSPTKWWAHC